MIGIAVTTTPNRQKAFEEFYESYRKHVPHIPLYIHIDSEYKGIVYSKNKCLAALYNSGCEHLFLFDDDMLINTPDFIMAYCESGLNHACWNYNRKFTGYYVRKDKTYRMFDTPNGCMLYITRTALEIVGGWDPAFKGYGYEHPNWSDRIFNSGLTPARYVDISGSEHMFSMQKIRSSVSSKIRSQSIPRNAALYKEKFYSTEFIPFQ